MSDRARRSNPSAAFEAADIAARPVLAAVLVMLLVLAGVLALLLPWRHGPTVAPPPAQAGAALLPDPAAELARYRAGKAVRLEGYGWVDEAAGVAHIPIGRAIDLLLQANGAPAGPREGGP